MEHLRALGDEGQAALAGVVHLLAGEAAVRLVPAVAAHALAGADLLLLCKPGGTDVDGLPRLRPIGMPEVLRKLAASALAGTVRVPAARLLAPLQMGVGVPNPCERVVHEVGAELLHRPSAGLLQLDFRNAFNLVSRPAAVAYLLRAFPLLHPHLESVYLGASAPRVYGWVEDAATADAAAGAPSRLWLEVQRGVQQGDPLRPLLHAAAMHLAVLLLATTHPSAIVRALHDDVVVVAPLADMPAVLETAAVTGAAVDAELAPAKCAGWSPAGAPAPAVWPARWHADGVRQFSIPLGTDAFVASAEDTLAAEHRRMTEAIVAPPRGDLQSQLLLLRLCAGPQPNYWLRALPLVWGARLAASVDRAAQGAVRRLLTDARDTPAVVDALLARAALLVSHGGLGIAGADCNRPRRSVGLPRRCTARGAAVLARAGCGRGLPYRGRLCHPHEQHPRAASLCWRERPPLPAGAPPHQRSTPPPARCSGDCAGAGGAVRVGSLQRRVGRRRRRAPRRCGDPAGGGQRP